MPVVSKKNVLGSLFLSKKEKTALIADEQWSKGLSAVVRMHGMCLCQ